MTQNKKEKFKKIRISLSIGKTRAQKY